MKTATVRALKHRGGLLPDNLSDLLEWKVPRWEGLKRRNARMWKIIVGDPRENRRNERNLSATTPEGISEIFRTRD